VTRFVYVNGAYLPYASAGVHVEDRGFQFGDAVYEVCRVRGGRLKGEERHMARLARSLSELGIEAPMSPAALANVMRQTVVKNRVRDGLVYLQVTRGAGPRDFIYPGPEVSRTVVCLARSLSPANLDANAGKGIAVMTMPDIRWGRCDIKTVMLLPACLAKNAAQRDGAKEAWLIDEKGFVTEGASSNAWIIGQDGIVITRPTAPDILAGVTRATLLDLLRQEGVAFAERPFRLEEALAAREAFVTSASNTVMPVVKIDTTMIGNGHPGELTLRLRSKFQHFADNSSV
jgi:D-alanine transaminase